MAIVQTGSVLELTTNNDQNASNETIIVPSDAELIIIGLSGYQGSTASYFTGGSMTLGGQALTAIIGGDSSLSFWMGAAFYKFSPLTGSQTLAWDWSGTVAPDSGRFACSITFWKGTGSVRGTPDAVQGTGNPRTSNTIIAQSGDKIVSWAGLFGNSIEQTHVWTSTTKLADVTHQADADGSWATVDPSGNQTVSVTDSIGSEGGLLSIVLVPSGVGGDLSVSSIGEPVIGGSTF